MSDEKTAFIKSDIVGKEVDIALSFHKNRAESEDYGVPAMLASLVTNEEADSLATAYANPDPDYASVSPFDTILTSKKPKRFLPKLERDHHDWATSVLPASVPSSSVMPSPIPAASFPSKAKKKHARSKALRKSSSRPSPAM